MTDVRKTMAVSRSAKKTRLLSVASHPHVLLVDDDESTRTPTATLIAEHGFLTHACFSAEAALAQFRNAFYPIVITNDRLPGMDGLTLCSKLRSRRLAGYVYIIVLAKPSEDTSADAATRAGADDYLRKTCPPAELLARLRVAERIVSWDQRLRRALEFASRRAASDALTKLPNRRTFNQRFHAEVKRAQRFGETLSVLLIDVDHFKQINDRYGHTVGDEVLRDLAGTLRAYLPREFDILARLGGEEFAAALPHTDCEAARIVAERLRSGVAKCRVQTTAGELRVTISVGIASSLSDARVASMSMVELLGEADHCLYESKKRGRNRVTVPDHP